jgi:hypothetical protein
VNPEEEPPHSIRKFSDHEQFFLKSSAVAAPFLKTPFEGEKSGKMEDRPTLKYVVTPTIFLWGNFHHLSGNVNILSLSLLYKHSLI